MSDRPDEVTYPVDADIRLSMVIPAYNEAERLDAGFARLQEAVQAGAIDPASTEFIVVDDGSSDGTADCARMIFGSLPHVTVIRLPTNRGKGAAVRAGVAAAVAPTIIFADADMAIDPVQTPQFLEALAGAELAIGSRAASGASVDRSSIRRSVMNRSFNTLVNAFTRVSLDDTQCGFKAFRGPTARLLFHCSLTERMAFDVEVLTLARLLGLPIAQVPVHWLRVKGSRVRSWSDSVSMVRDVLQAPRRFDRVPSVPAVRVALPEASLADGIAHLRRMSEIWPVIHRGGSTFLVLFPLVEAGQMGRHVEGLSAALGPRSVVSTMVTPADLKAMRPLPTTWDDALILAGTA